MFPKPTEVNELMTKYNDAKYESIESGPPLIFSGRHSKNVLPKFSEISFVTKNSYQF